MAAPVDDVLPLLVRVLAGNPLAGAAILTCLNSADATRLRRLHPAVVGVVAGVPWGHRYRYPDIDVVDVVRWRAALPGAVGVKLHWRLRFNDAAVAALVGVIHLDLRDCSNVTDKLLLRLPTSLRTLNVHWCSGLTARASFAHLTALASLGCSSTEVLNTHTRGLPPSLQELDYNSCPLRLVSVSLAHLSQLRVLRVAQSGLNDVTLAALPPSLVDLGIEWCENLTAAASFAHLHALRTLQAAHSNLCDAALTTLPPSLVFLDISECYTLTRAAALPPLPALRQLDVSDTSVGAALVGSLPAGLEVLCMVRCRGITAGTTLEPVRELRALYSMGTEFAPAVLAACRARGCTVSAAGELGKHEAYRHVTALAVLADGRLASGDHNSEMRLWDVAADCSEMVKLQKYFWVDALAVLPDGRRLALGVEEISVTCGLCPAGCIDVWNVAAAGAPPIRDATIPCGSPVSALAVLPGGRLAAGCDDSKVRIADVDAGVVAATLEGHSGSVAALAVLPNGVLASGSRDGTIRLWNVGALVCVATLGWHTGGIRSLAVLADGRLACGTDGGDLVLWDVDSRTATHTYLSTTTRYRYRDDVVALAALPDGRLLSGTNIRGLVQLWDTRPAAMADVAASSRAAGTIPMTVLAQVPDGTHALALLPDGRLACACNNTRGVYLLEVPPPATLEYR